MSSSRELQYLEYTYRNNRPTTGLLNSIFMTTVNTAARSLVSVASTASTPDLASRRWSASDQLRFMSMIIAWLSLWVLRVFLDYLPSTPIFYLILLMVILIMPSASLRVFSPRWRKTRWYRFQLPPRRRRHQRRW